MLLAGEGASSIPSLVTIAQTLDATSCMSLRRIIEGLAQAKLEAGNDGAGLQSLLEAFQSSLLQQNLPDKVVKTVKELHSGVSRLGKVSRYILGLVL